MIDLPKAPSFRLDGKRALVTGAGRGIGLGAAAALADVGAHVVLVARTASEIEAAAAAIVDQGGSAEPLVLDVTDDASVRTAIGGAAPFHILVNNAGINRPQPFLDYRIEDLDEVLGLNLRSAFVVAQAVARRMVETGTRGSLVHISSQMAFIAGPGRTGYSASKAGLEGLSRAIALEMAPHGVRSNTVCPTFLETPLTRPFLADAAFKAYVVEKIKLGRVGKIEDVLGAIVYLASDAASLVTGTHVLVDGGWTLA